LPRRSRGVSSSRADPASESGAINLGWLGTTVGFHLRTAQEAAFQAFAGRARNADARPWRFAILLLIDANPDVTQGELAAAIRRNTSSLTPALNELVHRGYVVRRRTVADRRNYALRLTSKGRRRIRDGLTAQKVKSKR
jgi:DNA-binding MarR family transcriptional regulator